MPSPDERPPSISIIIPCLRHAGELRSCLHALIQQHGQSAFEVLVVDSACDPAVEQVASEFASVRLLRSRHVLEAGAARNLGARHARADVLGFIDADCIPQAGWVEVALGVIRDGVLLAGGAILDQSRWHWIASTDNRLQFVDFPASRPAGINDYFPGANIVIARSAYDAFGGFAESALGADDVLLTSRIAAQWPAAARFCPRLIVSHQGRRTLKTFLDHQRRFGYTRSLLGLQMSRYPAWLVQRPYLGWMVFLRRLSYITARVVQWNMRDLPRFLFQLPILLIGLGVWTSGFYDGLREKPALEP